MSDSKKPPSDDSASDELPDRLKKALNLDYNKPDTKEFIGSPISPLRPHSASGAGPSTTTTTTTTTTSSSSSSGSVSGRAARNLAAKGHSGEISSPSTDTSPTTANRKPRPGHSRSNSYGSIGTSSRSPTIFSGGSSSGRAVNSPPVNILPAGNICPSGRILKTGMATRQTSRTDVLGTGTGLYGHGSIMRGGSVAGSSGNSPTSGKSSGGGGSSGAGDSGFGNIRGNVGLSGGDLVKKAMLSMDPEEVKRIGNDQYKKRNFTEALGLYERAIALSPRQAAYRSNKAAALTGLGRLPEAVKECEEAVRLEPGYARAHYRLGSLLVRLGCVEVARKHLHYPGQSPETSELEKLQTVEKHLIRCNDARKMQDWKRALREAESAIVAGADSSPQLQLCRAESHLKLQKLSDALSILSTTPNTNPFPQSCSLSKFSGMLLEAYLYYVRAQVEMSRGRFDEAMTLADKANKIDPYNLEVATLMTNVKLVGRARTRGNDLFRSERLTEACAAYGEGLRHDPSNCVLYCNRAACWFKLGLWDQSLEDSNRALSIQPNYTKALLRRAATHIKLENWAEAVSDYEALKRELPEDNEVAESLFHAQVSLKKSRGEDVSNMKFGGEVEEIFTVEQFRAAISFPGASVVHFKIDGNPQCKSVSAVLDTLCIRYPSINFLKVDLEGSVDVAEAENVRIVPTLKIYKNGKRVKEIINPTSDVLEASVRHYSL